MQQAKNAAVNVAASAKAGLDKTKATVQEKVERMTAHDPMQKGMATERKEEKIHQAEYNKQEARDQNNLAARQAAPGGGTQNYTAAGGAQPYTPGGTGLHNHLTSGHNPDYLTGSNITHGTGHNTHHVDALGANTGPGQIPGGADAVYPNDDDFGFGLNPAHPTRDANVTGGRTGPGMHPGEVDAVYPEDADFGTGANPTRNTNVGFGAPGTGGTYR